MMDLCNAARSGDLESVQSILVGGANVNQQDPITGNTGLHYAASYVRENVVTYLIKNHADLNKTNRSGETPLLVRVKRRLINIDIVQCLLSHKADLCLENIRKETAFDYATDDSMKKLLQEHVTVSKVNEDVKESTELSTRHRVDSEAESHDTSQKALICYPKAARDDTQAKNPTSCCAIM